MASQRNFFGSGEWQAEDNANHDSFLPSSSNVRPQTAFDAGYGQFGANELHRSRYEGATQSLMYSPTIASHIPALMMPRTLQNGLQYDRNGELNGRLESGLASNDVNNFGELPGLPSALRGGTMFGGAGVFENDAQSRSGQATSRLAGEQMSAFKPTLSNQAYVDPAFFTSSQELPGSRNQFDIQSSHVLHGSLANTLFNQPSNQAALRVDALSGGDYGMETEEAMADDEDFEALYDAIIKDPSDQVNEPMSNGAVGQDIDAMSAATPTQVDQTENGEQVDAKTDSQQSARKWNANIKTMDDAKKQLKGDSLIKLTMAVDGDDFEEVEREDKASQQYSKQVFNALLARPHSAPVELTDEEKEAWWSKQDATLEKCKGKMESKAQIDNACSRCIVVINTAVVLHKTGLSVLYLNEASAKRISDRGQVADTKKPELKTTSSYIIDRLIKCSTRIGKIVKAVKDNKQIALDILNGGKPQISDLVRAPTAYSAQKRKGFGSNLNKAKMLKDGKELRESKAAAAAAKAAVAASRPDDGEPVLDAAAADDGENE